MCDVYNGIYTRESAPSHYGRCSIVAFAWHSVHAKDICPLYNGIHTWAHAPSQYVRGYILAFAWNSVHAKDIFLSYNGIDTRGMCAIPICEGLCCSICVTQCSRKNVHSEHQMHPKISNNCRMWVSFESDIEFKKGAGMSISNWIPVKNIPWNYMRGRVLLSQYPRGCFS